MATGSDKLLLLVLISVLSAEKSKDFHNYIPRSNWRISSLLSVVYLFGMHPQNYQMNLAEILHRDRELSRILHLTFWWLSPQGWCQEGPSLGWCQEGPSLGSCQEGRQCTLDELLCQSCTDRLVSL